ncbi:EI24 domain-containing protein [Sodalinema gerasimenkoae]|uniref:EI24 domain-containing protein n=1 Tax=Sodalinema gerasimenkoae TaxID=2862348 RepID=UPI00135923C7|nr:EI24 domain-containing protein [Sodalinema gerasimenkoae]
MTDKSRDNWFYRLLDLPVGVVAGALYPLKAIAILAQNSKLWGYIAFPILLNLIIGVGLYIGLLRPGLGEIQGITVALDARITAWIANLPQWLGWLSWFGELLGGLLQGILVVGLFLATGLLLVQFGAILGSPWYGQLSEELEKLKTGKVTTYEQGLLVIFKDIWRALAFEVKKLILALGLGILLFLANWVPGLGTLVAGLGGVAIAALIVCLDFLDAPLERRRLRFRDKLKIVVGGLPATATFSLVSLFLVSIPFVNLLAVPVCVAAGTLLFCDRIYPRRFADQEADTLSGEELERKAKEGSRQ